MRACGHGITVAGSSRTTALYDGVAEANFIGDQAVLRKIVELAADPRDFLDMPGKQQEVIDYLNARLIFDGLRLETHSRGVHLVAENQAASVVNALHQAAATIDFDTVKLDLDRALKSADDDPEDAATSACSVVESVCRSILVELNLPFPANKDIRSLYRAVAEPLGLSAGKEGIKDEIADDVRTILGGLASAVQGIGALRTHAGDAHGRERGYRRVDARIARMAIHSASALALFLIETWQTKYPSRELHAVGKSDS
ncbi:abortive infection family protein [Rhizobium laguerreae]|nr:abortive infection family protein [Rhizobium laguerreae]MBY3269367.1 abortive infection family protein [Rhizobium laguerreae]MBY3283848.1 abortive infection family protein [Rhizobium laguerreae]MBY3290190.1 abortive infection family protein [Rhizobium laguerreae]